MPIKVILGYIAMIALFGLSACQFSNSSASAKAVVPTPLTAASTAAPTRSPTTTPTPAPAKSPTITPTAAPTLASKGPCIVTFTFSDSLSSNPLGSRGPRQKDLTVKVEIASEPSSSGIMRGRSERQEAEWNKDSVLTKMDGTIDRDKTYDATGNTYTFKGTYSLKLISTSPEPTYDLSYKMTVTGGKFGDKGTVCEK